MSLSSMSPPVSVISWRSVISFPWTQEETGQPVLDRVVEGQLSLLDELQDEGRQPRLAVALDPHPRVRTHRLTRLDFVDAGRPGPGPVRPGDVGRHARGRTASNELV